MYIYISSLCFICLFSTCTYYDELSTVVGVGNDIQFSGKLGNLLNPVRVDIGNNQWTVRVFKDSFARLR